MTLIITETIELNAPLRPKIEAHRLGALAVHRTLADDKRWTITHLPTGLHFGFYWKREDLALSAMTSLANLAPWATVNRVQIEALGPKIYPLLISSGGRRFSFIPAAMSTKDKFNGYDKLS